MSSYYEKILATGEVKCIDEEVPFEIPKGWEWCRLGEISTYAQTKRKINASNADSQLWGLDLEDIEKALGVPIRIALNSAASLVGKLMNLEDK